MDILTRLALDRAGYSSLEAFHEAQGAGASLEPWLLGYRQVRLRPGDTFWRLAETYGTSVAALTVANPSLNPGNLPVGATVTVPMSFSLVPTDVPMTAELCDLCIRGLVARYPFCRTAILGRSKYGRPIRSLVLGTGSRRVLYNASHHANEWITTPVLLKFAEEYATALAFGGTIFGYDPKVLSAHTTVHLVPMVNPDGVDLVTGAIAQDSPEWEAARLLAERYPTIPFPEGWKANLSGVDLNLNYPAGWEQAREIKFAQGFTRPGPRDYVGAAPLDQPESKAMADYTRQVDPALTLAYHSQGEVIYWQYNGIQVPDAQAIGERFAEVSGYRLEIVPEASGYAGYKDWFIDQFRRPGYTIEVGRGTNPLPLSQFDEIYRDNIGILTLGMMF